MTDEVRLATRADEPEVIRLLHLMHLDGGMLPLDLTRAKELFATAWDRTGGIIGVIGDQGDLRGMICIRLSKYWYTTHDHLEEIFNFVHPDHRRSSYGRDLIVFAKDCSEKMRVPLVIGVLGNDRVAQKVRLYRRLLGVPAGAFFVYGANWVNLKLTDEDFWKTFLEKSLREHADA